MKTPRRFNRAPGSTRRLVEKIAAKRASRLKRWAVMPFRYQEGSVAYGC